MKIPLRNVIATLVCCAAVLGCTPLSAQWVFDPEAPEVLCDAPGLQRFPALTTIGNDRFLSVWTDNRSGSGGQVFMQILDLEGNELLESNGQSMSLPGDNLSYQLARDADGHLMLMWFEASNTTGIGKLWAMAMDADADLLWDEPLLVASSNFTGPDYIGPIGGYFLMTDAEGFSVVFHHLPFVSSVLNYVRFSIENGLENGLNGSSLPNYGNIGSIRAAIDHYGGAYIVFSTGNGAGAAARLTRIAGNGEVLWANPIVVTEGTGGLSYNFSIVTDPHGASVCWEEGVVGNQVDLRMRRYSPSGVQAWNGTTVEVSNTPGTPLAWTWTRVGDFYQFAWVDNPVPFVTDYFVQIHRIDTLGNNIWQQSGIPHSPCNGGSNVVFRLDADTNVVVLYNDPQGNIAIDRYLNDGSIDPAVSQIPVALTNVSYGSGGQKTFALQGDELMAVWTNYFAQFSDSDLNRSSGSSTLSDFIKPSPERLMLYPNPVAGERLHLNVAAKVGITDLTGKKVWSSAGPVHHVDVSSLPAGLYLLEAEGHGVKRFVKQ